ncbi:MAG: PspC domain-containing protein [Propionibacteriales bacterium]|nr:PspC domain-containing protein [Propionibacteriales bacterium]
MSQPITRARRASRDPEDRFLGGVASGMATHVGIDPLHARLGFVALTLLSGFGAIVYAALWMLLPVADVGADRMQSPGLSAATRQGLRTSGRQIQPRDMGIALSISIVGLGAVVLLQVAGLGTQSRIFWPLLVASLGLALLWWQADQHGRGEWLSPYSGWKSWVRILLGAILLAAAGSLALFQAGVAGALDDALGAIALAVAGVTLVIGPWLLRLSLELRRERAERVRSQERADVAAHLHDSVLQTLALIQRQAYDSSVVSQLARTQERELRTWLFESTDERTDTLKSAMQRVVVEVETTYQVPVEMVVVGDAALDEGVRALVAAAREAMANAARHSGASRVDAFVEVVGSQVEVFIRDRGRGFDVDEVPDDRLGVRRSIIDRVARYGGTTRIRSDAEDGTEITMTIPCQPPSREHPSPRTTSSPRGRQR